mgnify:CR=1 FL=1
MDEGKTKKPGRWKRWFERLEKATKAVGVAIAAVAILSFVIPPLGTLVNVITAWRFGAVGYVYYEVAKKEGVEDGNYLINKYQQLRLLASGGDSYEDISMGDRLQAASEVNFREEGTGSGRIIFVLSPRDCVVVLRANDPYPVTEARSGGWLKVATTACGLFG